jgi:hypothetical protein
MTAVVADLDVDGVECGEFVENEYVDVDDANPDVVVIVNMHHVSYANYENQDVVDIASMHHVSYANHANQDAVAIVSMHHASNVNQHANQHARCADRHVNHAGSHVHRGVPDA